MRSWSGSGLGDERSGAALALLVFCILEGGWRGEEGGREGKGGEERREKEGRDKGGNKERRAKQERLKFLRSIHASCSFRLQLNPATKVCVFLTDMALLKRGESPNGELARISSCC